MPTIYLETIIAAPIETVFDLSRNISVHAEADKAHNLRAIAGVTEGLINLNEIVTWEAKHFGFRLNQTSKIIAMNRPHSFADEMVKGMFHHWHHLHKFETLEDGKTKMIDLVDLASPFGILGKIVDSLYLINYMKKFLIEHNAYIKKVAEENLKR
jgi:ligand-binding SRPBCC domain-containing protein